MIDLSTNISTINLSSCMMNASGCHCTTKQELDDLTNSKASVVVSKSSTILCRDGNPLPRLYLDQHGSINSMGIPNNGYEFYLEVGSQSVKPFMQSIYPFDAAELKKMLADINNKIKTKYLVEINLSCPNLKNTDIASYNTDLMKNYLEIINQQNTNNLILGIKMPPFYNLTDYDYMSSLLLNYKNKIKFITCSNSVVNGLIIDSESEQTTIYPKEGLGGIGGIYCKPVCLANVFNFYKRLKNEIQIIGCGGISSGQDVFEYILCGASCIQIGTHLLKNGLESFDVIEKELIGIMNEKGYNKLADFCGKLKIRTEKID